jgi:hypothetical protein
LAVGPAAGALNVDVLVVADGDVWSAGIGEAVEAVAAGRPWAMPHGDVRRLTKEATDLVLAGDPFDETLPLDRRPYAGFVGGGMVVVRSDVYRQVPLDLRFVGWGQEDESWGAALRCLFGDPWRGETPLWHLWHEPQPRRSRRIGSSAGQLLAGRYQRAAKAGADAMWDLVREVTDPRDGSVECCQGGTVVSEVRGQVWRFRNRNTGQEVVPATDRTRQRLTRLSNWELIERPYVPPAVPPPPVVEDAPETVVAVAEDVPVEAPPPAPAPVVAAPMVAAPTIEQVAAKIGAHLLTASDGNVAPCSCARGADHGETDFGVRIVRPTARDDKAAWLAYAAKVGVDGASMTKAQVIAACRG